MKSISLNLLIVHSAFFMVEGLVVPKYNRVQENSEKINSGALEFGREHSPSYLMSNSNNESKQSGNFPTVYAPDLNPYMGDNDASNLKYVEFHANPVSPYDTGASSDDFTSPEEPAGQPILEADSSKLSDNEKATYGMNTYPKSMGPPSNKDHMNAYPKSMVPQPNKVGHGKLISNQEPKIGKTLIERSTKPDDCESNKASNGFPSQRYAHRLNQIDQKPSGIEAQSHTDIRAVEQRSNENSQSKACYGYEKTETEDSPILEFRSTPEAPIKAYGEETDKKEETRFPDGVVVGERPLTDIYQGQKNSKSLSNVNSQSANQASGTNNSREERAKTKAGSPAASITKGQDSNVKVHIASDYDEGV